MSNDQQSTVRSQKGRRLAEWLVVIAALAVLAWLAKDLNSSNPKSVVVYAAQDQVYAEPILQDFEKQTGIKVRAVYDSEAVKTVGLANRLLAERNHPQCDVFWGNEEMRTCQLAAQDVFRDTNGWATFGYRSRRIIINTNYVAMRRAPVPVTTGSAPVSGALWRAPRQTSAMQTNESNPTTDSALPTADEPSARARARAPAPESLLDLTNAIWRGKVALADPQFGTTATHFHVLRQLWGDAAWQAWCRALAANKPFLVDGNSVVVSLVGRGEAWLGLTDSDDIGAGQREGLPVAALPLTQEMLLISNTVGVIRGAPHPQNAQRLFEYLQRREIAAQLARAGALEGSSLDAVTTPTLDPDWPSLLRDLETTTKELDGILLR